MNVKPKHALWDGTRMHVLFLLRCATKDAVCLKSHDIRVMHTRVKTTEFIAFCCISGVFLLILCTLPNIATPSALCRG